VYYEQSLAITRAIGDRRAEGNALGSLGIAHAALSDPHHAIAYHEQYLAIARDIGDRRAEGNALNNLGNDYAALGDSRHAIECYEQHLAIVRNIGDRQGEALTSWNLGEELANQGNLAQAVAFLQVCVDYEREVGHPDAEQDAVLVEQLRQRLTAEPGTPPAKNLSSVEFFEIPDWDAEQHSSVVNRPSARPDAKTLFKKSKPTT
jgi:tetratricopeptide (TPR) repeat protein